MEQIKEHLKEAIDYFDQGDKETAQQKIDEVMTQEIQSRLFLTEAVSPFWKPLIKLIKRVIHSVKNLDS